jgi:hypothetical protein
MQSFELLTSAAAFTAVVRQKKRLLKYGYLLRHRLAEFVEGLSPGIFPPLHASHTKSSRTGERKDIMNALHEMFFTQKYRRSIGFVRQVASVGILVLILVVCFGFIPLAKAHRANGSVIYVMTNDPDGNTVIQYDRAPNGQLTWVAEVATGGLGFAGGVDPLGSQDGIAWGEVAVGDISRPSGVAVNAGSNQISSLSEDGGLHMVSIISSGGEFPNSVALHDDLVYVLNAYGVPNITGFRVDGDGLLTPLPGSTVTLPFRRIG